MFGKELLEWKSEKHIRFNGTYLRIQTHTPSRTHIINSDAAASGEEMK